MIPIQLVPMIDHEGTFKDRAAPSIVIRVDKRTDEADLSKALKSSHGWPQGLSSEDIDAAVYAVMEGNVLGPRQRNQGRAYFGFALDVPDDYLVRLVGDYENSTRWEFVLSDDEGEPMEYGESSDSYDTEMDAKIAAWRDHLYTNSASSEESESDASDSARLINQLREQAVRKYASDGEIEIDAHATVSISEDGGAYVAAWVWVDNGAAA